MKETSTEPRERYHDLDALRAVAMLLGIALHGALSFVPFPWGVQDTQQHGAFGVFFFAVHGFRMPVFFVMSGFFTAMLWRRRGLVSTLKQRLLRVFLPCMVGLLAIVPLNRLAGEFVFNHGSMEPAEFGEDLIGLTRGGDLAGVRTLLSEGVDPNQRAGDKSSALHWAAVSGYWEISEALLAAGADVNGQSADGGTPLHWTAFLGEPDMVNLLVAAGADPSLKNDRGETPIDTVRAAWDEDIAGITTFFAGIMKLQVDLGQIEADRPAIRAALGGGGTDGGGTNGSVAPAKGEDVRRWIEGLFLKDVFGHLWFLWFLCWLVAAFSLYALIATALRVKSFSNKLITSPLRYLWLLPLTILPQLLMHSSGEMPGFGPDTSTGWLPFPHLLFYYAIFFFFGALYHDSKAGSDQVGAWWWISLPLALLVVFPLGMEFSLNPTWSADAVSPERHHLIASALQVLYTWLMIIGSMGLFRMLCSRKSPLMRYISDSSYWLYLAHLPLILMAQWFVRDWALSPFIKFPLVCLGVTSLLLLSYQFFVRYTPIGTFLNGPRRRPAGAQSAVD